MRRTAQAVAVLALATFACGCATPVRILEGRLASYRARVMPPPGVIYSGIKAPLKTELRGPIGTPATSR